MDQDAARQRGEGRNMRRRVLTIVLFLLFGAAINVGVAWGCA